MYGALGYGVADRADPHNRRRTRRQAGWKIISRGPINVFGLQEIWIENTAGVREGHLQRPKIAGETPSKFVPESSPKVNAR
jgi:hypothetical protein